MKKIFPTLFIFFFTFFTSPLLSSNTSPVVFSLIKGQGTQAGILIEVPPGWHMYGPAPQGENAAGFPPSLTSEGSLNLKTMGIRWPTPHKTTLQGQVSYIYGGTTLIPLDLVPHDPQTPITLHVKVNCLACGQMCVPVQETLSLKVVPGEGADPLFKNGEQDDSPLSLLALVAIALLGGFILNFMPCVLPVLSLKVMSLIKHSKKTHSDHIKTGFLITGLGILTSFLLLALLTFVLKQSGEAVGWGIHFQNPHFLVFVFLILIAFSASLWGLFEVDLPSGMGKWLISHEGKGKIKDFLGGVFATLLATPCSAPFVGTALSFALGRSASDIFLVFFCLGLGFAFPYFFVAFLPPRFVRLPKPGPWMVIIQRILGGFLTLTALWIGWILCAHLSLWVLGASVFLTLCGLSFFWVKHHRNPALKAWLLATPLFLLAWGLSWTFSAEDPEAHAPVLADVWKPFQPETISELVQEGKIVIVDATAQWCVTCAVNKKLVLRAPSIVTLLKGPDVIAMRADWTKKDPVITEFLQKYDRYGIPFNIIFGPGAPEGIVLPEILTSSSVEEAFKKAARRE